MCDKTPDPDLIDFAFQVYEDLVKTRLEETIDIWINEIPSVITDDEKDILEMFQKKNKKAKAASHFVGLFVKCDNKGKYNEILDFAEESDQRLLKILSLDLKTGNKNKDNKWKEMIRSHLKDFKLINISTTEILFDLTALKTIPTEWSEEIEKTLHNRGNIKAIHQLLQYVPRTNDDWFVHLLTALYRARVEVAFKLEDRLRSLTKTVSPTDDPVEISAKIMELLLEDDEDESAEEEPVVHDGTVPNNLNSENVERDTKSTKAAAKDECTIAEAESSESNTGRCNSAITHSQLNIALDMTLNDLGERFDPEGGDHVDGNHFSRDEDQMEILQQYPTSAPRPSAAGEQLELRPYQEELAVPGLAGLNTVIFAPTGSGKTHVAIKIALEHLKARLQSNVPGKVAFLVPSKPLADQQSHQFSRYLSPNFKVGDLIGGEGNNISVPLPEMMQELDVIVMTAQIVVNSLKSKHSPLKSIREFSMIIFDECHHCDKGHPYNEIMMAYFDDREAGHTDLPQILGLTASLGTNKAQDTSKALEHILNMLSNLDMKCLKSVKDEQSDLVLRNRQPDDQILYCEAKDRDFAGNTLEYLMQLCEQKAVEICGSISPPERRGWHKYTNFVNSDLEKVSRSLTDRKEERIILNFIIKCLDTYNRAYMMSRLIRSKDAKEYILRELWNDDFIEASQFEGKMKREFMRLQECGFDGTEKNPALETLRTTIKRQFSVEPDSRVLIFVKERSYTIALHNWFEETMEDIVTDIVVGAQASATTGGQTQNTQQNVLNKFRTGMVKVVICTSVLEEGLDVPQCNLVIRYGYVTNETAMVQTKGRGRAINARYIVIVPRGEEWLAEKEKVNKKRDLMMREAAEDVSKMTQSEFIKEMAKRQRMTMMLRKTKAEGMKQLKRELSQKIFRLECLSCGAHACDSNDIRVAERAHHVVLGDAITERLRVKTATNPKTYATTKVSGSVMCAQCRRSWGSLIHYRDVPFPNIAINNFHLIDKDNPKVIEKKKKWKEAPFHVEEIEIDEIFETQKTRGSAWLRERLIVADE